MPTHQGALPISYACVASDVSGGEYYGPDVFFGMKDSPIRVRAAEKAYDANIGRKALGCIRETY